VATLPPENTVRGRDVDDLTAGTRRISASGAWTVYEKDARHYLKVPERRADILPTRAPELRISELAVLPPTVFTPRGELHSHVSSSPVPHLDTSFDVPPLRLRRFDGAIRHLGQMAVASDHTLLPPSFTINEISSVRLARNITSDFASLPDALEAPASDLPGVYYDLNPAWYAHFGHFITEIPAKLWGWEQAREQIPGLKAIVGIRPDYEPTYERDLLRAYGIADADIHWARHPVTLESYVACTPMWHNTAPHFVHPDIVNVWSRLSENLADARVSSPERLFVARKPGMRHRDCRNASEVEALFEAAGFRMVYPENHTLAEQAGLFSGARVVAGFGGSGLFNALFARRLEKLIVLNHEAYTARNEYLFAAALGADTHYFWSRADREQPTDRFSDTAFHSGWDFDFDRNGAELKRLLSSL
jgi:capsular polysaccharide biosynthesis protein